MARKPGKLAIKRNLRRRNRVRSEAAACEQLEPRSMLAVAFVPDAGDPWGFNAAGSRATSAAASIDAMPRDVFLPAGQVPRQTWALENNSFLALYGSDTGTGTFRYYSSDGTELGWPSSVGGKVKDMSPIYDSNGLVNGFLVWGTVASAGEASWVSGGFDTSFGGGVDGFVARLGKDGTLAWATLIGGAGADTVEGVALSPDGNTIFVVGDTSSSGGFVNGTADQVLDKTSSTNVAVGVDTKGQEVAGGTGTQAGLADNPFAGTASFTNGYVFVMSADGKSHIWSSYLSPNDPRSPQPSGFFTASHAAFVTDVENSGSLNRIGIVVSREAAGATGGAAATSTAIVTLVEKPTVSTSGLTGPRSRDFEFKSISNVNISNAFLGSVRSRPAGGAATSRFYYYMTAADPAEVDTTAYDPLREVAGTQGKPSKRSVGRVEFRTDVNGNVTVLQNFFLDVSSFSLTGFFPTPNKIYLTGTALSEQPLGYGQTFSRYHTWPQPQQATVGNNYGDAVLVELTTAGVPVRSQFVGNTDSMSTVVSPTYGLKEKGGGIVAFPDGTVKLLGAAYAQPRPGQGTTPATGGKMWNYKTGNMYSASATAAAAAPGQQLAARPAAAAAPFAAASSPSPTVQWSGYIGGTANNDVISDVWTIPKTVGNGLPADQAVIQVNGARGGFSTATLADTGWNDGIQGTVSQIQLNQDATKLYVAGSTATPGWTSGGFDNKLGTYFDTRYDSAFPSSDGFFARIDVKNGNGKPEYSTYLGGAGETFNAASTLLKDQFRGNDYSAAFYIDPSKPADAGQAYVVGRSDSRSGLGSQDGVTDQPEQENKWGGWPNSAFDPTRSRSSDARKTDGVIYSLFDRRDGSGSDPNQKDQLNWASYLTPRVPGTPGSTDDNEPLTKPYLTMNKADFVWVAKNSKGAGNIVYVFGEDEVVVGKDDSGNDITSASKQIYVFNDATVNDSTQPITSRIKKYAFDYATPDQIVVDPLAPRSDGSTGPAVYFRTTTQIRRINLPATATTDRPLAGLTTAWTKTFNDNEIQPNHMAVSGGKLYVASTVSGYQWSNFPAPLATGKLRNGASDAALVEMDATRGMVNWWMIQGGDGADVGKAVAAFPDGRVWLLGESASKPTDTNASGWIPQSKTDNSSLNPVELMGNSRLSPTSNAQVFTGGQTDGFVVEIQANTTVSKGNVGVGGVVAGSFVAITNNAAAPSTATGTDFGSSVRGQTGSQRVFRIQNTGAGSLSLYGVQTPAGFKIMSPTQIPSSLVAGGSLDITVAIDSPQAQASGTFTGYVVVNSNDADEGAFRFFVTGTVLDSAPVTFRVAAAAASIAEGDAGTKTIRFTVSAVVGTPAPTFPVTVRYQTVGGTATAGSDFVAATGTLTFNAEGSQTVDVTINGDTVYESDETFQMVLSNPSQGLVSADSASAPVTIINDDPVLTVFSVAAATKSVVEGDSGTKTVRFTVTLAPGVPAPTYPVTVQYQTVGITATADSDFVAASGTLTFDSAGAQSVDVTINGDTVVEADETLQLALSNPTQGVVLADASAATVTILNDDRIVVGFASTAVDAPEGNSGTSRIPLTVTLSQASPSQVTVNYATNQGNLVGSNGFAIAGSDYLPVSGVLTFAPGETSKQVFVTVLGDSTPEQDETLAMQLSSPSANAVIQPAVAAITIRNDDGPIPLPAVRVSNAAVIEGNSGSPKLTFTVTLARAMATPITLAVNTVDATAIAGRDYQAFSGTVTFPAGRTSATVSVSVLPNLIKDGDRTLRLEFRNGATLVASAVGTIRDDDRLATAGRAVPSQQLAAAAFASLGSSQSSNTKKK